MCVRTREKSCDAFKRRPPPPSGQFHFSATSTAAAAADNIARAAAAAAAAWRDGERRRVAVYYIFPLSLARSRPCSARRGATSLMEKEEERNSAKAGGVCVYTPGSNAYISIFILSSARRILF